MHWLRTECSRSSIRELGSLAAEFEMETASDDDLGCIYNIHTQVVSTF